MAKTPEEKCRRIVTKTARYQHMDYQEECGLPDSNGLHQPYSGGIFMYPRHKFQAEPTPPAPIAAQTENPQVVTTYGVYLSVERYNRLIEYENNTKTHIKNRSILLNHAADLHEDLSKIAELVGIAKSGDLFNMSELIDAVRKLVVPAERVDAARVGLVKADNLFGVYCGGNPESVPGIRHWMRNMALFWEGWARVADFVNRKLAASLKQESQPPSVMKALKMLYDENVEYIRSNNLGDVHHNRSMQIARDVLGAASSPLQTPASVSGSMTEIRPGVWQGSSSMRKVDAARLKEIAEKFTRTPVPADFTKPPICDGCGGGPK